LDLFLLGGHKGEFVLMLRDSDGQRHSFSVGLFVKGGIYGLRIHRGAGEETLTKKASLIAL
jgi:hypothetical protein